MPHIHTAPGQHDHTASANIFRVDGKGPRVLLHRHLKAGVYIHFGGHIELDETPWQTIVHELLEEAGYDMEQLQILQPAERLKTLRHAVLHPQPVCINTHLITASPDHFHTDSVYTFITTEEPKHAVAAGESTDFILLTRQELIDLSEKEMFSNVREICLYMFDHVLPHWERVKPSEFK